MKTILIRTDRKDGKPCQWGIMSMRYLAHKLQTSVTWRRKDPEADEIELHGFFGIGRIMAHEDALRLGLLIRYEPESS